MQADDKEASNYQIDWVADIQANMQIIKAINIWCIAIAHLAGGRNQGEMLACSGKLKHYNLYKAIGMDKA